MRCFENGFIKLKIQQNMEVNSGGLYTRSWIVMHHASEELLIPDFMHVLKRNRRSERI